MLNLLKAMMEGEAGIRGDCLHEETSFTAGTVTYDNELSSNLSHLRYLVLCFELWCCRSEGR